MLFINFLSSKNFHNRCAIEQKLHLCHNINRTRDWTKLIIDLTLQKIQVVACHFALFLDLNKKTLIAHTHTSAQQYSIKVDPCK